MTDPIERLLQRVRQGDEAATRELLAHTYARLQRLARTVLRGSFPRVGPEPK